MTIARHLARGAAALGLASLLVVPQRATAQITYQGYPAPGGTTFSGSGTFAGSSTGADGRYSGFDDTQWGDLFWSYSQVANPIIDGQASTGTMNFVGYNSVTGIATWQSSANLEFYDAFGNHISTPTYLSLQFKPYASLNGQLGAGWLTPTTASLAGITTLPANQAVFDVGSNPGYNFGIWSHYTAGNGQSLLDWYNGIHTTGGTVRTSSVGAFYATDPVTATPEPTSIVLLATGMAGVFGAVRRRRTRA